MLGRHRRPLEALALAVLRPHQRHLVDQVDHAAELVLLADRELDRDRRRAQPALDHVEALEEVGARPVHLVHVDDARHLVLVGLAPDRLGLGLDAGDRVQDRHRPVQHAEGALDLHREVDVTRGVDDVDQAVPPEAGGRGRGDGDAALLLLHHPVHRRRPLVHLADLVGPAGVVEDALGRRGLPGIDVRHDADVSRPLQRVLPLHQTVRSFLPDSCDCVRIHMMPPPRHCVPSGGFAAASAGGLSGGSDTPLKLPYQR